MTDKRKAAPPQSSPEIFQPPNPTTRKNTSKQQSMLRLFATGIRLNRFTAEHYADHVLNSTVSKLESAYGLQFSREWTTVWNRFGGNTRYKIYWLEGDQLRKARSIANPRGVSS